MFDNDYVINMIAISMVIVNRYMIATMVITIIYIYVYIYIYIHTY